MMILLPLHLLNVFIKCIYYLCNSNISFAISVPILPAPRTVPEDIPGTPTKDCFTASGDKNKAQTKP